MTGVCSNKSMELASKTIAMRLIEEEDAQFVLSLRLDPKYNKHLSLVDNDLEKQVQWIQSYKKEEKQGIQYYFIIKANGEKCGTVRLYDFKDGSFCWGSWILNENKTRYAAVESALLVYRFGFEILNFKKSHFDVRKENSSVISFHKKFGAEVVGQDDENFYFNYGIEQYQSSLEKYAKFL
jgi:RimJ/RimL family protein N-acetyltransferase